MALEQDERVKALHFRARTEGNRSDAASVACLNQYVAYLEQYTLQYIHTLERFLFRVHLEPRTNCGLQLSDVLTPANVTCTLRECNDPIVARTLLVNYYRTRVLAVQKRERELHVDDNYEPKQWTEGGLEQLPHRIEVNAHTGAIRFFCPARSVYRGYTDALTLYEHFCYEDSEALLTRPPTAPVDEANTELDGAELEDARMGARLPVDPWLFDPQRWTFAG